MTDTPPFIFNIALETAAFVKQDERIPEIPEYPLLQFLGLLPNEDPDRYHPDIAAPFYLTASK
jgi:hypothetical protein